ncbi:MAG: polysaccharide deacetylase family protein [Caulobacteraceae bacterium]|nr:polysaccharide deacetylase family protein [Caulobacter sp.]
MAYGVVAPGAQMFGQVLTAPRRPGEIALTFDDGPNPTATPELLDLLARHGVCATFFLIGRWAVREPGLVRRIVAERHTLGCHTMTHPRLPLCSRTRIARELREGKLAVEDIAGRAVQLFRPPHGFRTPFVLATARGLGMRTTTWTTIGNDWKLPTAEAIAARVEGGVRRSWREGGAANVVLHDGGQGGPTEDRRRTVEAVGMLLERLPDARFVPLDAWR